MRFMLVALVAFALPLLVRAETKTYTLDGMTCGSCVKSVKAQVCKLPGVETCEVEINKVTLTGKALDDKAIEGAVSKAGYTMTGISNADAPAATPTATPKKKAHH
ncbi:MAG TPA: heavy-metal-associated domain-containing protein [Pseudobdellovibrionaceae bacterium]|nr:heavy-metal-associated domain-containing protein [Pseudobdellovibrionaceae bacterium]